MSDRQPLEGEVINQTPQDAVDLGAPNRVGRPSEMTIAVVTKLISAFHNGYNITEACHYAGIARVTYYRWLEADTQFSNKMSEAQAMLNRKAKEVVASAIAEGDANTARWYLNARDPEFKAKGEVEVDHGLKQTKEKLRGFLDDTDDLDSKGADATSAKPTESATAEGGGDVATSTPPVS